ncbi:helicase-exonuclease AddAB subunit AddA [Paenibacillus dendritiformis]|uniref:ATP-dependent helicase/nuclease subunit A n=1 Tax=Paenibacillus dendritiformis C454 TaxID=1131935 RepID=H3SDX6_9BACL|nr:helicase-exonuclease AddAB subunit AddA [Paenibacillus dendritiformis]EHQ62652.1 recombination helicase AddA [Paenibacillus dendritiformis C454]CAH8769689.1 helicase-exonuclease AddAB subunit AddA [Paenibacillus dendritiformis]
MDNNRDERNSREYESGSEAGGASRLPVAGEDGEGRVLTAAAASVGEAEAPAKLPPRPPESTWTEEQWQAIVDGGENILVAAAAGSGKTAVLVERIISRISDEAAMLHVDQLLVATFTKAAAAEMRERIRLALERKLEANPDSEHLRRQLALLNRASITTLHSFCLEVIQRHFQAVQLDPAFRVANETEIELLRQDVLEELFEERYASKEPAFARMVDWFSGERNDEAAFRLVHRLYDFSRSHPWPEEWLDSMTASFGPADIAELGRSPWADSIMAAARLTLNGIVELLRQAIALTTAPGGPEPYRAALEQELAGAAALADAASSVPWERMHESFGLLSFGRLAACRGDQYDKELQEQVKRLRDQAKKRLQQVSDELFRRTPEQFLQELHAIRPVLETLASVVREFGARFEAAKRAKGWLDFADLEHYCLRILRDPSSTPERPVPSAAALQYQEQFAEILLDEYQDTNMVQEAIVDLITRPGQGNRFMVGDVKQSIYRFRLAEPGLFQSKYTSYGKQGRGDGIRIDLARNFRSRQGIVDTVNMVFRQIMNADVAELTYDSAAELVCGASYPSAEEIAAESRRSRDEFGMPYFATELLLIDKGVPAPADEAAEDEDGETERAAADAAELETARLEARAIASRIRRMTGDEGEPPYLVYDKDQKRMRPVTYRDMVILLRATQAWAPLMLEELRREGIPAYAEFSTGYFTATEVEIVLSLLRVIDNPQQDIPLAAVLRSPIVGLQEEEMAQIRLYGKGKPFYYAVMEAARAEAEDGSPAAMQLELELPLSADEGADMPPRQGRGSWQAKLIRFLDRLEQWRIAARQGRLSELIWRVYRETGYYEWVGGLAGGLQRQANLRALYDRARQYESSSIRGLFRFLRFIDRMRDTGGDLGTARALGEREDVVRIMTIHKSKGLEFPVVIVAGLSKRFNQQDLNASFLMHKHLGFGPKYVDEEKRVAYPTLPNLAIRRQMRLELLAEEQRVLYVALTRPKEKLILIGTVQDAEKSIRKWGEALDVERLLLPDYLVAEARSYLDWIGPAIIRHPAAAEWRRYAGLPNRNGECLLEDSSRWQLAMVPASVIAADERLAEMPEDEERARRMKALRKLETDDSFPRSAWADLIGERLSWRDPHRIVTLLPSKTSVTEMKRLAATDDWPPEDWVGAPAGAEGEAEETAEKPGGLEAAETATGGNEPAAAAGAAAGGDQAASGPYADPSRTLYLRRPKFMERRGITPVERGTAYHLLMQHLPLDRRLTAAEVNHTLDALVARLIMTRLQADALDAESVAAFFDSEVGRQLAEASWVKRELPFSYGLSATEAYTIEGLRRRESVTAAAEALGSGTASASGNEPRFVATPAFAAMDSSGQLDQEMVLVQGIIDCLFEWNGELVLLDYKTDKVLAHRGGLRGLTEHYRFQLELYARAIEDIWKRPVKRKVLYFFDAKQACEL